MLMNFGRVDMKTKGGEEMKKRLIGRSAITGRFMKVSEARKKKKTAVVEKI